MTPRSAIFISAVGRELESARQAVAAILRSAGLDPVMEEMSAAPAGDARPALRAKIDRCHGLIQLVGHRYGFEVPSSDSPLDPQSYSHFEVGHAFERKLPVWFLILDETFPRDAAEPESPDLAILQSAWRVRVRQLGRGSSHVATHQDLAEFALQIAHEAGGKSTPGATALAMDVQGTYAEAEQEIRARIATEHRHLGPEHPETLRSRSDLGAALNAQGKLAEAELEYRAVLALCERAPGPEHPEVFGTCYHLALTLARQKKYPEALELARRAEDGWRTALYEEHPKFKLAKALREQMEREPRDEPQGKQ